MACYKGPNPITQDERTAVWKWAKENGIDQGMDMEKVYDAVNQHFYAGQAKPGWIHDIFAGPKSPVRTLTNDLWRKQYNRKVMAQQAEDIVRRQAMGPIRKALRAIWAAPRSLAVLGHFGVFPISHGGDLIFRPASWGTFLKGTYRTYAHSWNAAKTAQMLHDYMHSDKLYDLALRSELDVGPRSHATGILSAGKNTISSRAWDMLTLMRFELWKKQMGKYLKDGMTDEQALDIGQQLANWANHATGSAPLNIKVGKYTVTGGELLFGPKLTGSKIARLTLDPAKTLSTIARMASGDASVTAGERAAAWTRLSGATQFAIANAGFLAVNAGVLAMLGSKQKINYTDPTKGDFLQFKAPVMGTPVEGNVPGLHSEIKFLANTLAVSFASKNPSRLAIWLSHMGYPQFRQFEAGLAKSMGGDSKRQTLQKLIGGYLLSKTQPGIQHGVESVYGEDWMGRPMPWSNDPGKPGKTRLGWAEWAATMGPIPLEGPIKFVYDEMRRSGASALDSTGYVKALIIGGLGLPGFHIREETPPRPQANSKRLFPQPQHYRPPKPPWLQ